MQGSLPVSGRMSPPQQVGGATLNLPGSNLGVGTSATAASGVQHVGAINPGVNPGAPVDAGSQLGRSATAQEGVNPANA